jgi:hypothetical protein
MSSVQNKVIHMELSLRLSFYLRRSLRGYTMGTTAGFPVKIRGYMVSPTISPQNPAEVPAVTYEYLFCPLLSDQLQPPARWRARGLLSGSNTPGILGHQLRTKILDTIGFL